MSTKLNELFRGDDRDYNLHFTDGDAKDIDITDWTVYFTLKKDTSDSDENAAIKKTIISHSDPTHGKTTFSLTHTETYSLIPTTDYHYDIQIKKKDGSIITVVAGILPVLVDVTRRTNAS